MNCVYCKKICKNDNSKRNHERLCKSNPNRSIPNVEASIKAMAKKIDCEYCGKGKSLGNIKKHQETCSKNPNNQKECPVCSKMFVGKSTTCGYSCSNTLFRSGKNNPNFGTGKSYRSPCFEEHGKKCIVCGEDKIVSVHHVNEDHHDNRVENLIPLCPTHHQYLHSRYKDEVQPIVDTYLAEKYSDIRIINKVTNTIKEL